MDLFRKLFKRPYFEPEVIPAPKPTEICPSCKQTLTKIYYNDGEYCGKCGTKLSNYVALPYLYLGELGDMYQNTELRKKMLSTEYRFRCPRCKQADIFPSEISKRKKIILICSSCDALLHQPEGFCPGCWTKLADNGICMNFKCHWYQKPKKKIPKVSK